MQAGVQEIGASNLSMPVSRISGEPFRRACGECVSELIIRCNGTAKNHRAAEQIHELVMVKSIQTSRPFLRRVFRGSSWVKQISHSWLLHPAGPRHASNGNGTCRCGLSALASPRVPKRAAPKKSCCVGALSNWNFSLPLCICCRSTSRVSLSCDSSS